MTQIQKTKNIPHPLARQRLVPVLVFAMSLCVTCTMTNPASAQQVRAAKTQISNAASSKLASSRSIVLRSSTRDEAFTEPIETVNVAAGESGIVSEVLLKRGDVVTQGQLLAELDQTVLDAMLSVARAKANTNAKLKAMKVEFETKKKRYDKLVELKQSGAGSPEEVDKANADMEVARQNMVAIEEQTEQFRLEMNQIEAQIEQRKIRSPIDGVVTDVRRKAGEFISINDPHIVTLVQLETLRAVFYLPTARATKIHQGDEVDVMLTETDEVAKGIVEYVAPVTRAASGRVRVDILIDNTAGSYRSGVRCQIRHGSERTSMMSPNYK